MSALGILGGCQIQCMVAMVCHQFSSTLFTKARAMPGHLLQPLMVPIRWAKRQLLTLGSTDSGAMLPAKASLTTTTIMPF